MSATVSLSATLAVAEGGTITYTASVGAIAASSAVTVALANGQTITISAGKTSGTVTIAAPADVYAATPGMQATSIASVMGDGGFGTLSFNPAQVTTTVSDVVNITTVRLTATTTVAEGGTITYTASTGTSPAHSDVAVTLNNGQTIIIAAGQTSGTLTVAAPNDVYVNTPGNQTAAIASLTGTGGFESLTFNASPVTTAVSQVTNVTTLSLSATATVAEGGTVTYTASVGANPAHSNVTVTLNNGKTITIASGQTSGSVTVVAPADVFANTPGAQTAAITSISGTGGFESLSFSPAAVSTVVTDVINVTTASLSATTAVAEGGAITYTASLGANPAHSAVTVVLDNGQTITIGSGQTSGSVTVAAASDVYAATPGTQVAAIASLGGTGGFESLSFNPAAVTTTVSNVINVTTVGLSATAAVLAGGTITYTASLGANPTHSDVTVTLDNGQTITIAAGQTSGTVAVAAAANQGIQSAAIAGITGTGGFESLAFDPAAASTAVSQAQSSATVSLAGTSAVAEGGAITYTASVGATPASSAVTVALDNGQTITIAAGQTSGTVTVLAPVDVYAGTPGVQVAAIAGVTGTGGFSSLAFDPAPVSTTVTQVTDITTVSLSAPATVAEGGALTYTASLGVNPAHSDVTVALNNGQTITIAAGQTSGTVTVVAPVDVYAGTPGAQAAAIAGVTGTGGFESLVFDPAPVSTTVSQVTDITTVSLSAPAAVAEGGALTYTASLGVNPAHSDVTVALNNGQTITIAAGQTSGTVTAPASLNTGVQSAAIASVTGTGGFESLAFDPAAVSTTVSQAPSSATVSLAATTTVAEGGAITYTASVGATPASSAVTVVLDNGQTITIASGQTSGAVTVLAPMDVYAGTPGAQVAAIASVTGTGGFSSLVFDPAPVSTTVTQVTDITTVSLSAPAAVAEGGTITYTASVGANPAHSAVSVALNNGQTITIAAGQTSGAVTVVAPADVYVSTPGTQTAAIASITGSGGFESLAFDPAAVSTTVTQVTDITTVSLSATAAVAEAGTITYTASLGANAAHSAVAVALNNGQTITIAAGQTSGTVTVVAPADVYAGTPGPQTTAIASLTGTGGFESLSINPAAVTTTVSDVVNVSTVSLSATAAVAEGGAITYTASVGANPVHSDLTVALNNGRTITIAAGQTSGAVTLAAPADVYAGTPGVQTAAIASVAGTGGFESLSFNPAAVSTTVSQVIDTTTVSLSAPAAVAADGTITYTASVGANPALSAVTVSLDIGQTITIAAGQTRGTVTVLANTGISGAATARITSIAGTGGFESLSFDPATVSTSTSSSYDLIDTTANLADPLITPAALANGAANITATTPATVAQAVAIDAYTNSGATNYSISDNAFFVVNLANPAVTPPAVGQHAINVTVSTPVTEAQAQTISLLTNTGTLTYNLADQVQVLTAQTPEALRAGNRATNISVTFSPSTGTIVTLAQAAIIDAFTNSGTNSYDLQDTAANLVAATASVLSGGNTIIVTGAATVAQAADLQARAVHATFFSYALFDTAANLAAAPAAVGSGANQIITSTAATVAQAAAIQAIVPNPTVGTPLHIYDLSDTAAALAVASASVGNGAQNITATGVATVAQATIVDAFTNNGVNSYVLTDTAANLAAASASVGSGAAVLTATTAATVAQATVFAGFVDPFLVGGGVKNYSLSDTAASLAAASPLVGNGATNITATDAATVAQAIAIDAFTNGGVDTYALADTAANLAAASALIGNGATTISATTAATVAQANAIHAFTNSGTNSFSLADTAANLAATLAVVANQATNITTTDGATVAQANTIDAFLNTGVNSYSLADSSANLLAAAPATISAATLVSVTTPVSVADAVALLARNAHTVYNLSDTAANLAAATAAAVGNAATNITVNGTASVAEAAAIDALTNSGSLSYALSDSSAHLAAAAAALLTGATTIAVSDGVTVAAAAALHAANANATYGLSDTAANLAALVPASNVGQQAILINATNAVTVAQIDAIHAYASPGVITLLALTDSAANLAAAIKALPALPDPALVHARSFTVTGAASVAQADAIHGYNATSAKAGYALSDTAANLAAAITLNDAALSAASSFAVTGTATAAQAGAIHGYNAVSALASYLLADTGAALVAAPAATLHAASDLTVTDTLLAAQATTLTSELATAATPFHYSLTDSATNLAALPAALVTGHTVAVVGPANVAEAATIHSEAPLAAYSIVDSATTLATALTTGNASLAAVKFAGTIDVAGPLVNASLTVNADQFHNLLLAGHPLLAANDTIALDGDVVSPNLGTLTDFGGNDAQGIVLGGPRGGSYIVNLGTSGDLSVTMSGTGHQDITAAVGPKETFVVGATSTGGSTIRNLERNEVIDVTAGNFGQGTKNSPSTQVASGSLVTGPTQWAYETASHTLTWWDPGHNAAETLTLHFAASGDSGGVIVKSTHSFQVI